MIKTRSDIVKTEIDLSGPMGNAYTLIGYGGNLYKNVGSATNKTWNEIRAEMMSGDYENLIAVFDREFGEYVDLVQ